MKPPVTEFRVAAPDTALPDVQVRIELTDYPGLSADEYAAYQSLLRERVTQAIQNALSKNQEVSHAAAPRATF